MIFVEFTDRPTKYVSADQGSYEAILSRRRMRWILSPGYNTRISVSYHQLVEEVNEVVFSTRGHYARHRGMRLSYGLLLLKDALPCRRELGWQIQKVVHWADFHGPWSF